MADHRIKKNHEQKYHGEHKNNENYRTSMIGKLRGEIDELKAKVRAAYALDIRKEDGDELSKEELELIEDQALNSKLIEKLERFLKDIIPSKGKSDNQRPLREYQISTMLKFFYLVRLAQQGFFYLIPTLEPQAVTYLADKLVASSIHANRIPKKNSNDEHMEQLRVLVNSLHDRLDEPVAEEFKTTFKQIMDVVDNLSERGLIQQVNVTQPSSPALVQPVWVVMPYTSIMDTSTIALPDALPSLPFPPALLSTSSKVEEKSVTDEQVKENGVKNNQVKEEQVKEEQLKKNEVNDEQVKEGQVKEGQVKEEQVKENEVNDEQIKEIKVKEEETEEEEEEYEEYCDDDDRFADPDEDLIEAEYIPVEHEDRFMDSEIEDEIENNNVNTNNSIENTGIKETVEEEQKADQQEENGANVDWANFVASNQVNVDKSNDSSPKSEKRHYKRNRNKSKKQQQQ